MSTVQIHIVSIAIISSDINLHKTISWCKLSHLSHSSTHIYEIWKSTYPQNVKHHSWAIWTILLKHRRIIVLDFWTWTIQPNWAIIPALITVQPGENESNLGNDCPDHFLRKWLSCTNLLHQTILRNCSQLWTSKEWLPREANHSTWSLPRVTAKKNECPRPFPHTFYKGNHCLWYINNLSNHFHY